MRAGWPGAYRILVDRWRAPGPPNSDRKTLLLCVAFRPEQAIHEIFIVGAAAAIAADRAQLLQAE